MSLRNNFSPILNINTLLLIGYTAWEGFLKSGNGAVICLLDISDTSDVALISTQCKTFYLEQNLNLFFLTKSKVQAYLQEWVLNSKAIIRIIKAVDDYNPQKEIILVLKCGNELEVDILVNSVISPVESYKQISRRWEEFKPSHRTF
ncbi:MAG: hypothetical protein KME29_10855 [Calothrix sp. FI2-JRJ7]|jgi:hypothetical protein|nr:hypothetical protein [Calothrix sp. FI2-JRJ7]